jgi:hypothetical protein
MNRIHITLPEPLGNKFKETIPRGLRSIVCRCVIDLVIDAVDSHGPEIIGLLAANDIKLCPNPRMGQNLTKSEQGDQDENIRLSSEAS